MGRKHRHVLLLRVLGVFCVVAAQAGILIHREAAADRDISAGVPGLSWEERFDLGFRVTTASVLSTTHDKLFAVGAGPFAFSPGSDADILVRSYDAPTGHLLWTNQWGASSRDDAPMGIAVNAGLVHVAGSSSLNSEHEGAFVVRAYDDDTGEVVWEDRCGTHGSRARAIAAQATRVFVVGSCNALAVTGGLVRAYDARTGRVLWEASDSGPVTAVAVHEGSLFVAGFDAAGAVIVRGYDGRTGVLSWEVRPIGSEVQSATLVKLAARRDAVIVAVSAESVALIAALAADNGKPLWQHDVDDHVTAIMLQKDRVFVAGSGNEFFARAYGAHRGELIWTDHPGPISATAIAVGGGQVFVAGGGEAFRVRAYDAASGRFIWEDQVTAPAGASADTVDWSGGRVFVGGSSGRLAPPFGVIQWLLRAYDTR